MSIKVDIHGYGSGHFKRLEGVLMTLLETLGLPHSQEKAIKDLVRSQIWKMWEVPSFSEEKEIDNPTVVEEDSD